MENQRAVLLVDDEQDVRDTAAEYLQSRGLNVITAASGTEAMVRAASSTPPISVLVTDFVMPDMSGMDLAMHLVGEIPDLRTLFITGFGHNVVVNAELAGDSSSWLPKPVSLRVLEAEVRRMLGCKKAS